MPYLLSLHVLGLVGGLNFQVNSIQLECETRVHAPHLPNGELVLRADEDNHEHALVLERLQRHLCQSKQIASRVERRNGLHGGFDSITEFNRLIMAQKNDSEMKSDHNIESVSIT